MIPSEVQQKNYNLQCILVKLCLKAFVIVNITALNVKGIND